MQGKPSRVLPLLGLLVLVTVVLGVGLVLVSDRLPEPVIRMEESDLAGDPVFSRKSPSPIPDAESTRAADAARPGKPLPLHGFCPADGRVQGINLRKTLWRLLSPKKNDHSREFGEAVGEVLKATGEPARAVAIARRQTRRHPDHARAHVLMAYAAWYNRDPGAVKRALASARQLDSQNPYLALALAGAHVHSPDLDPAIRALDVFLESRKDDKKVVGMHQLRARLDLRRELQQDFYRLDRQGVSLLANPGLSQDDARAIVDLTVESLELAAKLTGTRRLAELTVVVYRDRSELLAVTCSANWAGGVFDGTLRLQSGKRRSRKSWRRTVRHECVHAQLQTLRVKVPNWFHEGLAQLVAGELGNRHIRSYQHMLRNQTYIPFAHMNDTFRDFETSPHAKIAYHQSLAMLLMMIEHRGPDAVAEAVRFLGEQIDHRDLIEQVTGKRLEGRHLLKYLETWRDGGWKSPDEIGQ